MMLVTESPEMPSLKMSSSFAARPGDRRIDPDSLLIGAVERRRGLRIRESRPIKIYEPAGSRYIGGQTADISTTGLQIELPLSAPMRPGHVVNVHVGLNSRGQPLANRRQMMPARVIWVRPIHSPSAEFAAPLRGRLLAGVEFVSSIAAHLDAA